MLNKNLIRNIIPFYLKNFIIISCLIIICNDKFLNGQTKLNFSASDKNHFIGYSNSNILNKIAPGLSLKSNSISTSNNISPNFNLFGNFGNNILDSFKGNNLYLHLTAIAATAVLVTQDVDYNVEHYFNQHEEYGKWARPILFTGQFLPFAVGGGLFAYGKLNNNQEAVGASFAVLQASLIEFLYNSTLKAITGRPGPHWRDNSDMDALSKTFRFGFMRGGIFWGWPSGHTSATMAVVSALTNYYSNSTWLKIVGYSWVAYTIFGVSSVNRGGMHWFSDAIAAALMSYAVGSTVGKYYRKVYESSKTNSLISHKLISEENPIRINLSFQF